MRLYHVNINIWWEKNEILFFNLQTDNDGKGDTQKSSAFIHETGSTLNNWQLLEGYVDKRAVERPLKFDHTEHHYVDQYVRRVLRKSREKKFFHRVLF